MASESDHSKNDKDNNLNAPDINPSDASKVPETQSVPSGLPGIDGSGAGETGPRTLHIKETAPGIPPLPKTDADFPMDKVLAAAHLPSWTMSAGSRSHALLLHRALAAAAQLEDRITVCEVTRADEEEMEQCADTLSRRIRNLHLACQQDHDMAAAAQQRQQPRATPGHDQARQEHTGSGQTRVSTIDSSRYQNALVNVPALSLTETTEAYLRRASVHLQVADFLASKDELGVARVDFLRDITRKVLAKDANALQAACTSLASLDQTGLRRSAVDYVELTLTMREGGFLLPQRVARTLSALQAISVVDPSTFDATYNNAVGAQKALASLASSLQMSISDAYLAATLFAIAEQAGGPPLSAMQDELAEAQRVGRAPSIGRLKALAARLASKRASQAVHALSVAPLGAGGSVCIHAIAGGQETSRTPCPIFERTGSCGDWKQCKYLHSVCPTWKKGKRVCLSRNTCQFVHPAPPPPRE